MRAVLGLVVVILSLFGCASQGVPTLAMHVRPAPVDPNADTAAVARRLVAELQHPGVGISHVAPEQIASVAVREIEQDHQVDAALWLAIASYRYHQETFAAIVNGFGQAGNLPTNVRRGAFIELVKAEASRFSKLGFQAEVRILEARAYGQNQTEQALQQQHTTLGKTSEIERESLRDALWQLQPAPAVTSTPTRYPELADAFHKRLLADAKREREDEHPGTYLARTPIPQLQADAVEAAVGFFDPGDAHRARHAWQDARNTLSPGGLRHHPTLGAFVGRLTRPVACRSTTAFQARQQPTGRRSAQTARSIGAKT